MIEQQAPQVGKGEGAAQEAGQAALKALPMRSLLLSGPAASSNQLTACKTNA